MAHLNGFNANDVDPNAPRAPIPQGDYLAIMTKSERKPTKSGNGDLLMAEFTIQGGQHDKRTVKAHLNLWNANAEASRIAWGDMSAICRAVGIMEPNDTTDLHNIPIMLSIGVGAPDSQGRVFNEIKGYSKRGGTVERVPGEDDDKAPEETTGKMPWE